MKESILKFETLSHAELQEIDGGVAPMFIPVAVGFVKGFVYTAGAIMTTRKILSGN